MRLFTPKPIFSGNIVFSGSLRKGLRAGLREEGLRRHVNEHDIARREDRARLRPDRSAVRRDSDILWLILEDRDELGIMAPGEYSMIMLLLLSKCRLSLGTWRHVWR